MTKSLPTKEDNVLFKESASLPGRVFIISFLVYPSKCLIFISKNNVASKLFSPLIKLFNLFMFILSSNKYSLSNLNCLFKNQKHKKNKNDNNQTNTNK